MSIGIQVQLEVKGQLREAVDAGRHKVGQCASADTSRPAYSNRKYTLQSTTPGQVICVLCTCLQLGAPRRRCLTMACSSPLTEHFLILVSEPKTQEREQGSLDKGSLEIREMVLQVPSSESAGAPIFF